MPHIGTQRGFTLIELMIAVVIVAILATIAVPSYRAQMVRAQVSEALNVAGAAKLAVATEFAAAGEAPADRTAAAMSADASDTSGEYVESVDVDDGVIVVTFNNEAHPDLTGAELALIPYESPSGGVAWQCGDAPAPSGLDLLGTASGGNTAVHRDSTVEPRYMPASCRD